MRCFGMPQRNSKNMAYPVSANIDTVSSRIFVHMVCEGFRGNTRSVEVVLRNSKANFCKELSKYREATDGVACAKTSIGPPNLSLFGLFICNIG